MANIVVATQDGFNPYNLFLNADIADLVSVDPQTVTLDLGTDETLRFVGANLVIDKNAASLFVSGTVTAIYLDLSDSTQGVSITGISVDANALGALVADVSNEEHGLNVMRFLMSGDDTYQGADSLNGDVIYTGLGNDEISAGTGGDIIYAGPGAATIDGGEGRDTLNFSEDFAGYPPYAAGLNIDLVTGIGTNTDGQSLSISGIEDVIASLGNDTITANDSDNFLFGNDGDDWIFAGGGKDILYGGSGQDTLDGGAGDDMFSIGEMEMNTYRTGDKLLIGGAGQDLAVTLGSLSDFVYAFNGDDNLVFTHKESGAKFTLVGIETVHDGLKYYSIDDFRTGIEPPATDIFIPEDTFWSYTIPESVFGPGAVSVDFMTDGFQPLPSWIRYDAATRTLSGTPPKDDNGALGLSLTAIVNGAPKTVYLNIDLTPVNDAPTGLTLNNGSVVENAKVDTFVGLLKATDVDNGAVLQYELVDNAGGRFKLDGARLVVADPAKIDYEQARSHSVTIKVSDQFGASATETFTVEVKDVGKEVAVGGTGNDTVKGGSGSDKLRGGLGKDVLTGGKGKDTFVFDTKASKSNVDKITDFNVKDDSIYLENSVFTKLGRKGTEAKPAKMSEDFFTIGSKAKDKNDYLVYDNKKGVLLYDADGSGKGKAVEIATLSKNLKMKAADFFII
jgi:Ca2+-binding RTX toxin-like protein